MIDFDRLLYHFSIEYLVSLVCMRIHLPTHTHWTHIFLYLFTQLWNCLERSRRCGLKRDGTLRKVLSFQKTCAIFNMLSVFCSQIKCELSGVFATLSFFHNQVLWSSETASTVILFFFVIKNCLGNAVLSK